MQRLNQILSYIRHLFLAKHTGGHGVHSPFFFQFTQFVLKEKYPFYSFNGIENLRKNLYYNRDIVSFVDFGTGINRATTVASIAKTSIKPVKQAQLLFRIANYIKANNVLELGTSLGLTTSYLASSSSQINCVTMEGSSEVAAIAKKNFEKLGLQNIDIVVGNIDDTLKLTLDKFTHLDLVFIDANHHSVAVLDYFKQCLSKIRKNSVVIIDDIYWSADMQLAWESIKNHPDVTTTIDLYHMGLVFFNTDVYKMHYKMRY